MRFKLTIITALLMLAGSLTEAYGQATNDTIYNPPVIYGSVPKVYEIAGVSVDGAPNYEDNIILGYAGLKVGDRIAIPGDEVTNVVKRLMRQGLFAQAQFVVDKVVGNKAWVTLKLRTQPRISKVNYNGMKKGEREDIQERLQLMKGNQITQNIINRAEAIVKKYYEDKGFGNAEVNILLHEDLSARNEMIVDINVDKHDKVKVHKIYIDGNEVMSDRTIQRTMKKTNEKNNLLNLFKQKKFVESDYQDDLNRILEKYNEKGYRDAKIVSDSVVPYDDRLVDVYITLDEGKRYYIKDINWVGNTLYSSEYLDAYLGMNPGDVYNQKLLNKRLQED